MEMTLEVNEITISILVTVFFALIIPLSYKIQKKYKGDTGFPIFVIGLLGTVVGCICIAASWCTRDYEELPVGTKVVLATDFSDGVKGYNYSGKYGFVRDSNKTYETVDVEIVLSVDENNQISSEKLTIDRDKVKAITPREFFEMTGIKDPTAQEVFTSRKTPTTQPSTQPARYKQVSQKVESDGI